MSQSMYGAVDLSALANKPQVATTTDAEGVSHVHGPIVVNIDADSLQTAMDTSSRLPVVLVFSSQRSEACVRLDEQLRGIAVRHGGRFQLGRVDVDEFPAAAQAFRVTGVPAVVALLQGQPVPLFQGAPDEAELESLIEQVLAAAAQYGLTATLDNDDAPAPVPELPEHHRAAVELLRSGDFEKAKEEFEKALKEEPGNQDIKRGLAQAELLLRVAQLGDPSAVLEASIGVSLTQIETHLRAADVEVAGGRPDAAFARLIDVVSATAGDERDAVRQRLLSLFDVVGSAEPVVAEARKALASALF